MYPENEILGANQQQLNVHKLDADVGLVYAKFVRSELSWNLFLAVPLTTKMLSRCPLTSCHLWTRDPHILPRPCENTNNVIYRRTILPRHKLLQRDPVE
jgi:hypothetical protein